LRQEAAMACPANMVPSTITASFNAVLRIG
jgi:hypothetical protein